MIVNLQGMGDILALTPLLQSLFSENKYEISLVGIEKNIQILKEYKQLTLIPISFSFFGIFSLAKKLSLRKPDIVFCSYRAEHGALLSVLIDSPYICGYTRSRNFSVNTNIIKDNNLYFGRDVRKRALNLSQYLGCSQKYDINDYYIHLPEENKKELSNILLSEKMKKIAIFVDNQRMSRSRNIHNRIQLINKTKNNNKIYIIMQNKEKNIHKRLIRSFENDKNVVPIIDKDIFTIGALLQSVDVFITADSGPLHLAFAVNCPKVIGLFGPTNPKDVWIDRKGYVCLYDASFLPKWNHNNEPITTKQLNIPLEKVVENI